MKFWKLHGAGNDFIAVDGEQYFINDYSKFAKHVCHRHFGIGADGILVYKKPDDADAQMVYYNSDGSIGAMCGNGIRCFSKFIYDNKLVDKTEFTVKTLDGIKYIKIELKDNEIKSIKVDMGKVNFDPKAVPVITNKDIFINEKVDINGMSINISSILIGVPHTVVFVDKIDKEFILNYGPKIEKLDIFPQKTNVNFVQVIDEDNIKVFTWERGCGYTLACGTGICSSVAVCRYLGLVSQKVNVESEGGKLFIELTDDTVYMNGPAVKICEGLLEVN
ncbi:diaminopimelate epimerase [Tepidibacter hydrothermalis]|uniref:Diaminopimelate epimerase n=1 Tax=Tepidibacter hydrothermalis TaxID=3036126 RepID=A0ABY8EKC7_9FIRM|nr:diaminopimelate epimerase [Tepidibacter hydrothermalis]WFD12372.1 diaminopimelate epimerase [Tepidibacter hydrothermalis]